jgi:glycosyltransferase involved in cell wall biosynthesis
MAFFLRVIGEIALLVSASSVADKVPKQPAKILICGVCRNVEATVASDIENMEKLGSYFADYRVIICEDNSQDKTPELFSEWAKRNPKVIFESEKYDGSQFEREERIARARNRVLKIAREPRFDDYAFVVMADLDFPTPWPVEEVVRTAMTPGDWDMVGANGVSGGIYYYDYYAWRNNDYPVGTELIGNFFPDHISHTVYSMTDPEWKRVYSAFAGLALYKRAHMIPFSYSARPTKDLERYYKKIIAEVTKEQPFVAAYFRSLGKNDYTSDNVPIRFCRNICCEHVTLHAAMAVHGFNHFYINPKMVFSTGLEAP